jgi:hypothetical protein
VTWLASRLLEAVNLVEERNLILGPLANLWYGRWVAGLRKDLDDILLAAIDKRLEEMKAQARSAVAEERKDGWVTSSLKRHD